MFDCVWQERALGYRLPRMDMIGVVFDAGDTPGFFKQLFQLLDVIDRALKGVNFAWLAVRRNLKD